MGRIPTDMGLLDSLTLIASRAAAAVLAVPRSGLDERAKADRSPVTAADKASELVILDGLARLIPGVTILSEEATAGRPITPSGEHLFIVDPLDGTREFLAGLDEFVVNIALMKNGLPVAGVVAAPAQGLICERRARPDQPLPPRSRHRCLCRSARAARKDCLRLRAEILPAGRRHR
jgi:3'-phosphoadenosine 5'-phosphosulfate (PAPS) 3'-phosphatase